MLLDYGFLAKKCDALKPGYIRLYRAEPDLERWPKLCADDYRNHSGDCTGRWFTTNLKRLIIYFEDRAPAQLRVIDLPAQIAEQYRVINLPVYEKPRRLSPEPDQDFFLPIDIAAKATVKKL